MRIRMIGRWRISVQSYFINIDCHPIMGRGPSSITQPINADTVALIVTNAP